MTTVQERAQAYGLTSGPAEIESVGPLAFGPEGILFVADNRSATIFAFDPGDDAVATEPAPIEVDDLDAALAAFMGCAREDVWIRDLAVHPTSGAAYLSVMRGRGDAAVPVLVRVAPGGVLSDVPLRGLPHAKLTLDDAPAEDDARTHWRRVRGDREGEPQERDGQITYTTRDPLRALTVTDMAYVDGELLVAGACNEEFASTFRRVPFPFDGRAQRTSLEIFHVSHGRWETAAPIVTFVPYAGGRRILAGYMCMPVVSFAVDDLQPGAHVKGKTVAELGSWNIPTDLVRYADGARERALVSSAGLPVLRLDFSEIERQSALTEPKQPAGVTRETLSVTASHMANLGDRYVLMVEHDEDGKASLRSHSTAAL